MNVSHLESSRFIGRRAWLSVILVASALTSGCAQRGGVVPYDRPSFGVPDAQTLQLPASAKVVGPLDKLTVSVFQVPELSGEFVVDAEGKILFPLLGSVEAAGKTPDALARDIATRLEARYVRAPSVQVAIKEATEQAITVEGSVQQAGVLPIKGATSLLQAVAMAHGTTEDANPSRVVVFRTINSQREAAAFDLKAIRRGEAPDPAIYGNDIIVVDGSRSRSIFKDIVSTLPIIGIFRAY